MDQIIPVLFLVAVAALGLWLFARNRRQRFKIPDPADYGLTPSRTFRATVAGVTHSNADGRSRQDLVGAFRPGDLLLFNREPDNAHDSNAVAVHDPGGRQLGYLPACRIAEDVARWMDSGERTIASKVVEVTGGTREKRNRGLVIEIQIFKTPKT